MPLPRLETKGALTRATKCSDTQHNVAASQCCVLVVLLNVVILSEAEKHWVLY
jgi:hypothetical protein